MVTWLVQNGKTWRIQEPYTPCFYIYSSATNLHQIARPLQNLPQVKKIEYNTAKLVLGSEKNYTVLQVTPKTLASLQKLAGMVDAWGSFQKHQLFNVDLRLSTRYLHSKDVFCNAWVHWDGKHFICHDEPWALDYDLPKLRILHLDIHTKHNRKIRCFNDPIHLIKINNTLFIQEENEADTILSAMRHIYQINPDVIYAVNGDSILFPFLYHRAKTCGVAQAIHLNRDKTHTTKPTNVPAKEATSYFSYGRIVYRPAFYTLKGRAHIDVSNSFLYGESGLHGIIDIARCANIPLQLMSRLGPGTAISQMQVNKARDLGYLIPWKKNIPETWKTAEDLLRADRGGLILDPLVGLHEDVVELDYASLYPLIIYRYNISPETMLCRCCKDTSAMKVPQLGYHICNQQIGLIPLVLKPVLYRRFCYKARAKNKRYDSKLYTALQQAWKWILLVCFGYTGYRNARYGRIECYESITAFSRQKLIAAMHVVEQAHYQVLHGIIDSLWVKKKNGDITPFKLSRMISAKTGLRMDVEGRYKWIVFLPSKQTGVGALNRYYGVFENGQIKVRGVELRQRNTPQLLKNMQQDMIKVLSEAENADEFHTLLPEAINVLVRYAQDIRCGDVNPFDCVFTTSVSRDVTGYKVDTLVKAALLQLRDQNMYLQPGQSVRYIVTDEHTKKYTKRVAIAELLHETPADIDQTFYLRQLTQAGESLLTPFGFTKEKLTAILTNGWQREWKYGSFLS